MRTSIDPEIFRLFPGFTRSVVVVKGARNEPHLPEVEERLRAAESALAADPALAEPASHPRISPWRDAFSRFGARPSKYLSSVEALVRRVKRGQPVPYINTMVALFNALSMEHLIPLGGDDLGRVSGFLELRPAAGDEVFMPLNGDAAENPEPGEVVFVDRDKVLCRRWNWRQGDGSKLTGSTSWAAVNVDGLPPVGAAETAAAAGELASLLQSFCGGSVIAFTLDERSPSREIADSTAGGVIL